MGSKLRAEFCRYTFSLHHDDERPRRRQPRRPTLFKLACSPFWPLLHLVYALNVHPALRRNMPPQSASSLFLGLELATDQLRASIVDDNLELVGVEAVDFDTELPEFQ